MDKNNKIVLIVIAVIVLVALVVIVAGKAGVLFGPSATTQCNDRIDNDGDRKCDYSGSRKSCIDGSVKGDTGCSSNSDNSEASCISGSQTCGVGACRRSSTCVNDQVQCTPGTPSAEVCGDSIDNDCDGTVNEECISDSCTDTDGGIVRTVQGTVTGYKNNTAFSNTDICQTNTTLREYYCMQINSQYLAIDCSGNGTISCSNGSCI